MSNRFPGFWLLVLALWLPATFHCPLEAAGLVPAECCSVGESVDGDHSPPESPSHRCEPCSVVELSGGVEVDQSRDLARAPVWEILNLPDLDVPRPEPAPFSGACQAAPPGEWSTRWRFALRTAASPRSPSVLLA